ncbi:MAG TPA: hypothetical protein VF789_08985 [Thermoanaerobaculia bacterium]
MFVKKSNPGMHKDFKIATFSFEEQSILKFMSREWYLTNSGSPIHLGNSEFRFFLMKPTEIFSEMFNIEREIIAVFSPYENFEPRSLDAFDAVQSRLSNLRVESVCRVLISKDDGVESKIDSILKVDPEQPIVIPFTYQELTSPYDAFFLRNRFRKHFYSRDLFSFLSPLRKDLYFFGRSALIQELINRHRSGEHTSLFGLRKSGKTSIIYAVERSMLASSEQFVSIDCESPSIHKLRWNELLQRIVLQVHRAKGSNCKLQAVSSYTEERAADLFSEEMLKIHHSRKASPVLVIFDEIERISPGTGSSSHWREGADFVYFWQTVRGFYQRHPNVITYMLVGTNPSCIEKSIIAGHENPLFGSIPSQYVPSFTLEQVQQMVNKLGRYMGLDFDGLVISKLAEDFGGHPFLIRQICSNINKECKGDRPALVDKSLYDKIKKEFMRNTAEYMEMIVQVLRDWYPDEYEMLTFLAQEDCETFNHFANEHATYTKHLIGYGLIKPGAGGYFFNIDAVKGHLIAKHRFERLNLSMEEKVAEVSTRRNRVEKDLRVVVRNALKIALGKTKATEKVLMAVPESRRTKLSNYDVDALLDRDASPLFFLELVNVIRREWDVFGKMVDIDKAKFIFILEEINSLGRPDAHAKNISADDFSQVRLHFRKMETFLEEWTT